MKTCDATNRGTKMTMIYEWKYVIKCRFSKSSRFIIRGTQNIRVIRYVRCFILGLLWITISLDQFWIRFIATSFITLY